MAGSDDGVIEMADTVRERVIAIIAEQAGTDPARVTEDATLADLGVDSLALVEAIFAIEEAFDVSIPFNANEAKASDFDISTIGAIVAGVQKLVADRAA